MAGIVLIALVVGLGWLAVIGIKQAPQVVGARVTALGAVLAVVLGRAYEKHLEQRQARRELMTPIYTQLLDTIQFQNPKKPRPHQEQVAFFRELHRNLIMWGSEAVIQAWKESQRDPDSPTSEEETAEPLEDLHRLENLMFAIRADLGIGRGSLGRHDLLGIYLPELRSGAPEPAPQAGPNAERD